MRCPNCNKFVPYDEPQCDAQDVEIDGSSAHVCVSVALNCAECGELLKDAEIEADATIEHECKPKAEREKEWKPDEDWKDGEDQFEVEADGFAEGSSRQQTKDRHGKPIKSARYMKTFYGFTLDAEIKCRACGEVFSLTLDGEEQASAFNECC